MFTFVTAPVAVDLLLNIKGLDFATVFDHAIIFDDNGIKIRTLHNNDLIIAKKREAWNQHRPSAEFF